MSDEAAMENYESIRDNVRRIKELEKQVRSLIIRNDILWDKERQREQSQ